MPQPAELRMIDGVTWARIPISGDDGRVQLLSDAEITANDQKVERLLAEIERLRAVLTEISTLPEVFADEASGMAKRGLEQTGDTQ